jgi:hypothetical protein
MSLTFGIDTDSEPSLESIFSRARLLAPIMVAVVTWSSEFVFAFVPAAPYRNNDHLNKELPSILKTAHQSLGGVIKWKAH